MTRKVQRIRPGAYTVLTSHGARVELLRTGNRWAVTDRNDKYSEYGFPTKREALEHIDRVDEKIDAELEARAQERDEAWARSSAAFAWINVGRISPVELAELIKAVLPGVNTAAWIASAHGPEGHATLLTWQGQLGDLDTDQLEAHGGTLVGEGLAIPSGYRELP